MNVTKENFAAIYPALKKQIKSAVFMSFDEEMTGISDWSLRNREDDDPDTRYNKMTTIATRYSMIQFGLCLFHLAEDGSYIASPYNFYLFPAGGPDLVLSLSAIDYLRQHNMNWQTWIEKGISFVDEKGEEHLSKKFGVTTASLGVNTPKKELMTLSTQADLDYMERNTSALNDMISDESKSEYIFEYSNSYIRRAVYTYLEIRHPGAFEISKTSDQRIKVSKVSGGDIEARAKKLQEEAELNFLAAMGFRLVFKDLVEAKNPVIGHNCMFDVMFLMRWLDGPLPKDLASFKINLSTMFPCVLDTKYIATSGILGRKYEHSTLEVLYNDILSENGPTSVSMHSVSLPTPSRSYPGAVKIASGFTAFDSGEHFHDAGWDAYCTGLVFHKQLVVLGGNLEAVIQQVGNKTFMMKSLYHMDLDPGRSNGEFKVHGTILHISGFPSTLTTDDLLAPFVRAGLDSKIIEIAWIDGSSCFAAVNGANEDAVLESLRAIVDDGWHVQSHSDYLAACKSAAGPHQQSVSGNIEVASGINAFVAPIASWFTSLFGADGSAVIKDSKKRKASVVDLTRS